MTGNGLAVHIRGMSPQLQSLSLKSMDSSVLTLAVLDAARQAVPDAADRILAAVTAAAFLHRNQTRANRANLPRTPYIEHPLRLTLRLLRWGVTNADVLVAAVLHDTVEDCAEDIARYFLGIDPEDLTDSELRRHVIDWMIEEFGMEVAEIVLAVTNADPVKGATREEKNLQYLGKVRSAIAGRASVFLVKVADFVDNALGLPHNNIAGNSGMVARLAAKYIPLVPVFQAELAANPGIAALVSDAGLASITRHLDGATARISSVL